jgi:hypothetical protein
MSTKLNYQTLTAVIPLTTLKLVFKEEMEFLATHRWLFLENQCDIIFAIGTDNLNISQLQAIRKMMEQVRKMEEQEKQQAVSGH